MVKDERLNGKDAVTVGWLKTVSLTMKAIYLSLNEGTIACCTHGLIFTERERERSMLYPGGVMSTHLASSP